MQVDLFSPTAFEQLDSPVFARALANKLQDAVLQELGAAVSTAFTKVIAELNATGHNLQAYEDPSPGCLAFRDEPTKNACLLRLAIDIVVSAGYRDTVTLKS